MTFKPGQKVAIINSNGSTGSNFVEGMATVIRLLDKELHDYEVRFDGDEETYRRFVDQAAQDDPQGYCDKLNASKAVPA